MSNFLESKFRNITVLLLVFPLAGTGINLVFAQVENPFQAGSKATEEDPFAAHASAADENPFGQASGKDENPFGKGNNDAEDPLAKNDSKRDRLQVELNAQLKSLQNNVAILKTRNERLSQKLEQNEVKLNVYDKSYQSLIKQLLKHPEHNQQRIALESLNKLDSKIYLDDETKERLSQLTDSQSQDIKVMTLHWLAKHEPAEAVRIGFQETGPWMAVCSSPNNARVQKALMEPAHFDVEETELIELVELVQDQYQVNVLVDSNVDTSMPITYKCSGLTLRTSLNKLLSAADLALHVHEDHFEIAPKGHAVPQLSFVYNVKGLLNDAMSLDGIKEQVEGMIEAQSLDASIRVVDKNRLTITATDTVHAKVSGLLGQLR